MRKRSAQNPRYYPGIAIELERICDYAKSIAKITIALADEALIKAISRYSTKWQPQPRRCYKQALIVFHNVTHRSRAGIPKEDDGVDAQYLQVYRELMTYVIANPSHRTE